MGWNLYTLPFRDREGDRADEIAKDQLHSLHNDYYNVDSKDENYTKLFDELTNGEFSAGQWDDKIETWLSNALIGDLDYARQLELMQLDQAFNSAEAEKNRQFNLDVSNTAYQRQAEDLRSAGYNPALVLGGGANSVPTSNIGSSHHQGLNHIDAILPFLSGVVGSAFNLVATSMKNNTALNVAQLNNKNAKNVKVVPKWLQEKNKADEIEKIVSLFF